MAKLEELKRQLKNVDDLRDIVRTMKTLSAVRIHQYQKSEKVMQQYDTTVKSGFASLLRGFKVKKERMITQQKRESLFIIFGSDLGLVGQFNEKLNNLVLERAKERSAEKVGVRYLVMGKKMSELIKRLGMKPDNVMRMPLSPSAARNQLNELFIIISEMRQKVQFDEIILFYNITSKSAGLIPSAKGLLPVDESWLESILKKNEEAHHDPLILLSQEDAFKLLLDHYLFSQLYSTMILSLATENAVRLQMMYLAEKHMDEYREEIMLTFHQERQEQITAELLDILNGSLVDKQEECI